MKEEKKAIIHEIGSSRLKAEVSDSGAELYRIYDQQQKREVLWNGDPQYWSGRSPVLFPNVGAHYNGEYLYNDQKYQAAKHGFARKTQFQCIGRTKNSVTHRMESSPDTKKSYPFDFIFEVQHTVIENRIQIEWKVLNCSTRIMYFTIGGHPAFHVPILPDTVQTDYKLIFQGKESLQYCLVDLESGTANADVKYNLSLENSMCSIKEDMFDKDALIFDDYSVQEVAIGFPDGSPYIGINCEGFSSLGVWSMPGAPFVCLEPWLGRCDNVGFKEDISKKPGIISLNPKKEFKAKYEIVVY